MLNNINANGFRPIYTYSYGNVSGYDLTKARGVEEFYALLRSSLTVMQQAQDNGVLEGLFQNDFIRDIGSFGVNLIANTHQQNSQMVQVLIDNIGSPPFVHHLTLNLNQVGNSNLVSLYISQTRHLTSLILHNGHGKRDIQIAILRALETNRSLVLLEIWYLQNGCYDALRRLIETNDSIRIIKLRYSQQGGRTWTQNSQLSRACSLNKNIVSLIGLNDIRIQRYIWRNWYNNIVKRTYMENNLRHSFKAYTRIHTTICNRRYPIYINGIDNERNMFINYLFDDEIQLTNNNISLINTFIANSTANRGRKLWRLLNKKKCLIKNNQYNALLKNNNTNNFDQTNIYDVINLPPYFNFCSALGKEAGAFAFSRPTYLQWIKQGVFQGAFFKGAKQGLQHLVSLNWLKDERGKPSLEMLELRVLEGVAKVVGVDVDALQPVEHIRGGVEPAFLQENYRLMDLPPGEEAFKEVDLLVTELKEEFENHSTLFQQACGNGLHIFLFTEDAPLEEQMGRVERIFRNIAIRGELKLLLVFRTARQGDDLKKLEHRFTGLSCHGHPRLVKNKKAGLTFFPFVGPDSAGMSEIKRVIAREGKRSPLCTTPTDLSVFRVFDFLVGQIKDKVCPILSKNEVMELLEGEFPNESVESLERKVEQVIKTFVPLGTLLLCRGEEELMVFDKEWLLDRLALLCFLSPEREAFLFESLEEIESTFAAEGRQQLAQGRLSRDVLEVMWTKEEAAILQIFALQSLLLHELKDDFFGGESHFLCSTALKPVPETVMKNSCDYKGLKAVFSAENRVFSNIGVFNRFCTMFQPHVKESSYFSNFALFSFPSGARVAIIFKEREAEVEMFIEVTEVFQGSEIVNMVRSFIKFMLEDHHHALLSQYFVHLESVQGELIAFDKAKQDNLLPWFSETITDTHPIEHIRLSDVSSLL